MGKGSGCCDLGKCFERWLRRAVRGDVMLVAETRCTGRCYAGGGWRSGKQAEFADVGAQRGNGSLIVGGDSRAMG